MNNKKFAVFTDNVNRLHHPATFFLTIPWVYVNMFAPEAFGAMVRIAVAFNLRFAVFTGEVFYCPLKFFHKFGGAVIIYFARTYFSAVFLRGRTEFLLAGIKLIFSVREVYFLYCHQIPLRFYPQLLQAPPKRHDPVSKERGLREYISLALPA